MAEDISPDLTVDASYLICPLPVIKASEAIAQLKQSQVLKIIATDMAAKEDLSTWAERFGHDILRMDIKGGVIHVYVRKAQ